MSSRKSGLSSPDEQTLKLFVSKNYYYIETLAINNRNIYKVHDSNHRELVIKSIKKEDYREEEARILRNLDLKHVIKLENSFECENCHYLVFKYYPMTLKNYLNRRPSENSLKKWAMEICEVLMNLEKLDILHRDIKLENILLTEESENADIVLIDFGSSTDDILHSKSIHFTPKYVAPEVEREKRCTVKSDVWSFGKLLEEMFPSNSLPGLQEILSACLCINPEDRPNFIQLNSFEFLKELEPTKIIKPQFYNDFQESSKNLVPTEIIKTQIYNDFQDLSKKAARLFYLIDFSQPKVLQRIWLNSYKEPIKQSLRYLSQQMFKKFYDKCPKDHSNEGVLEEVKMKINQYEGGVEEFETLEQFYQIYKTSKHQSELDKELLKILEELLYNLAN